MKKLSLSLAVLALAASAASAQNFAGKKIYINPGHGGYEASQGVRVPGEFKNGYRSDGSNSTDRWNPSIPFPNVCEEGCWESKHNLWRGLELERLLKAAGATVKMSRTQNRPEDDRLLETIGQEATDFGADMFLSIHSNGNGSNYLLTIFRGADPRPGQPFNINDPDIAESKQMAITGWKHLHANPVQCWQAMKSPTNPYAVADSAFYSSWTEGYHLGVFRKMFVPGYLAEIAFHDYKPETHRMLNEDYSKMVAFQLFTGMCESLGAGMPEVGIIAGAVKDGKRIFRDPLYLGATAGDHDQYKPINGATVKLSGNGVDMTYVTDQYYNGFFYFPALKPGTYTVSVTADGYDPYTETVECVAAKCVGPIALMNDPTYDPSTDVAYPNIYASSLRSLDANQVSFVLNADATSVAVNLIKDGKVMKTVDFGAQNMGVVTVTIPADAVPTGDYGWSVTARANSVGDEPKQITTNGDPVLDIANARGIAVDRNQTSPGFGRMYVTSNENSGKKGARMGNGIYVLDPLLSDVTNQGTKPYTGGISWVGNSSPHRVTVAPDGKVYVTDWTDNASTGLYVMDGMNPEAPFKTLFASNYSGADGIHKTSDGKFLHGSICDACVVGTGANTVLYTLDEDHTANVVGQAKEEGYVMQYNIGETTEGYDKAPDHTFGNFGSKLVNLSETIAPDGRGGLWVGQNRDTNSDQYPSALHINAKGQWDYYCGDGTIFKSSTPMGAMACNHDGSLIAVAGKTDVRIAAVTYDEAGKPSLTLKYAIGSTYGARPFAVDFDAADNVFVAYNDNGGGVAGWALPKENNEYTTVSNQPVKFNAGVFDSEIAPCKIFFDGTTFTAGGAMIEVYTASGVKVAQGYAVDATALASGVYIARTATQSIKVIK